MNLTETQYIKPNDPRYNTLLQACHLSKNLYNAALYYTRNYYFNTRKHANNYHVNNVFKETNNPDYTALPRKISQQVLKQVNETFKSFYALNKKRKNNQYDKPVKLPKYLDKQGYNTLEFRIDTISKRRNLDNNGYYHYVLCPRDLNILIISKHDNVKNIKVNVKNNGLIKLSLVYTQEEHELLPDNQRYASIDMGVNNVMSVFFNTGDNPLIYSGGPLKTVNQYYNKQKAYYQLLLDKGVRSSKRIQDLTRKRSMRIDWLLHNLSRDLVNQVVSRNINTIIIGYNKEWKQDINLGSRNNQNFVMIPFARLIEFITYKARLIGIKVITREESYTSKCSFLDEEPIRKKGNYWGSRVSRGVFKTRNGVRFNADVNGAGNIMRKVIPSSNIYYEGIMDVVVHPVSVKWYK